MILYKNIKPHLTELFKVLIALCFVSTSYYGQKIIISQVKVSDFDETSFAPSVKDSFLYFSSNKKRNTINSIVNENGDYFYDIFKVEIKEKNKVSSKIIPLSDSINRIFNETSSCFYGNEVYFSSNSFEDISKKKVGPFGIYIAKEEQGKIVSVKPFQYNDKRFNVAHPTVSSDGQLLIFSSDNIAGEGWSDLYFCKRLGKEWSTPQNLGININTDDMETFPRLEGNSLYFSSDRKGGLGGLDIYVSKYDGKNWSKPKLLPEPLNSKFDDFGYTANSDLKSGYFSSNRIKKKDGLFYFEYDMPIIQSYYQQELFFCYTLEETEMEETDSLRFIWNLEDGTVRKGSVVDYCFSDTGTYHITMDILDKFTGTVFENVSSYDIEINAKNKPVIDFLDIKPGTVNVFLNKKWTNFKYTDYYWIVDGDYVFEKDLTLKFKNKSQINIKLVIWDKENPSSAIGIERVVYK